MWDLRVAKPFGTLPIRNMMFFLITMIVAVFGYIFATAPTAHAADASWAGNALTYQGNQYQKITDGASENNTNLPDGIHYGYINEQQKAHIISFPAGSDMTTTTSGEYSEYSYVPPGTFNNRTNVRTITTDAQTTTNQGISSCSGDATKGIGWIICPVTNWLAGAMDWLFEILTGFLTVRPAQTNTDSALYRAWSVMRNFANIAFVIGFMIIIYSQLTSFGISNYGIKRVLPRLIIAAILVNISYWVCAIAIDLSNILGYALQDVFIAMRNTIIGTEGNSWNIASWESIAGFILSGGTAAAATTIGIRALAAGTVGNALYMLLPILVGVLMAVLVALLILAARQAIITVLVILAPLAFVAYLLPNTEKYFDKWRGLFMTMLLVFPMFSVLFGGAQLAGIAIIQNADSINLIILGMAVQVAPVVITPFLVKFSGSLLGRIAGMVNNPNRGAIDRTRKWASERGGQYRDRALAKKDPGFMTRRTQNMDRKRRKREGWQAGHKAIADARAANEDWYSDIQQATLRASQVKDTGETRTKRRYEDAKYTDPSIMGIDLANRAEQQDFDTSKSRAERTWENLKAGNTTSMDRIMPEDVARSALEARVRNNTQRSQAIAESLQSAKHVQQQNFAHDMYNDASLRAEAGGIDPQGAVKAEARAIGAISKAGKEEIDAGVALLNYRAINEGTTLKNLSAEILNNAADGNEVYDKNVLEAAIEAQAQEGAISNLEKVRMSTNIDQSMVTRVFSRNVGTLKQKGGFHLQANPALNVVDVSANGGDIKVEMNKGRISSLADTSASNLKDLKAGWIQDIAKRIASNEDGINNSRTAAERAEREKIYKNAYEALNNPTVFATIGDRYKEVQAIEFALRGQFNGKKPLKGAGEMPDLSPDAEPPLED